MLHFRHANQRFGHIGVFIVYSLIVLALARCALVLYFSARLNLPLLPKLMLQGARFDLITLAYLSAPVFLLASTCPNPLWPRLHSGIMLYYRVAFVLLLGMEAIGFGFLVEYDHRPDALLWDYLKYPHEVLPMLWGGFRLQMLLAFAVVAVAWWMGGQELRRESSPPAHSRAGWRLLAAVPWLLLLFLGARSSLDHRPANISSAIFSDNRLANELALNSTYTAAYALYARKNDAALRLVPDMPIEQAVAVVNRTQPAQSRIPQDGVLPTLRHITPHQTRQRPLNVVIVLEESLGARFVGALGGEALTPRLDALSERGLWLTRLYATGTRTVRGIEAVLCGFPPSPARSVVKRSRARRDFFTLAQALKPHSYENIFVYGGEPNFDDMGSFMLGNGFDRIVAGQDSFPDAEFHGSWGVSDEDWARQAHREFEAANARGPFFGFMLSTSNHTPWEFPPGRIDARNAPLASRANAVRYADYALGLFFDLALHGSYADNTVFVVVADHDARVGGDAFVPVERFHIPGLIIAPGLAPRHYQDVASQIDLITTVMPMLGVALDAPAIGRDLLAPDLPLPGRALMQYGNNAGLLVGDKLIVNTPTGDPLFQQFTQGQWRSAPADPELYELAQAYLNLADQLYRTERYQPAPAAPQ